MSLRERANPVASDNNLHSRRFWPTSGLFGSPESKSLLTRRRPFEVVDGIGGMME